MIYTGGFFEGVNFIDAFANCSASTGLVIGSLIALIVTIIFYLARRIITFKGCMECLPEGFRSMVPAILILTFATALKNMTSLLGAKYYVGDLMSGSASALGMFLPAIIFLVACVLAFATGTSWGTFGILIPIVLSVFGGVNDTMTVVAISACMAGAVCGDHCSPISDTTIMASAGSQSNHLNHVSTQLPYALTVAGVSFVSYILTGLMPKPSAWIMLPVSIVLMVGTLLVIRAFTKKAK
jgi:Na+/H+ antiporter NhaC